MARVILDMEKERNTYITDDNNEVEIDFRTDESINNRVNNIMQALNEYAINKKRNKPIPDWIDSTINSEIFILLGILSHVLELSYLTPVWNKSIEYIQKEKEKIDIYYNCTTGDDYAVAYLNIKYLAFLVIDWMKEDNIPLM